MRASYYLSLRVDINMATNLSLGTAQKIIESVKGKHILPEERTALAIDLAADMVNEARRIQTRTEKKIQRQLAKMMEDPFGKVFTTEITDQCFRSNNSERVADQFVFLLKKFGIPKFVSFFKQMQLKIFEYFGKPLNKIFIPLTKRLLRKETSNVIMPGEYNQLAKHIIKRTKEGVRINLNHLGEAILGENEAKKRLEVYIDDLARPEINYISVKISTIYSQINLLDWEGSLEILAERLRLLYREAIKNKFVTKENKALSKFVNLDMEEYRDLYLTVALFQKILDEPEFLHYSAGIVLQSYLPDSYEVQKKLTEWALKRKAAGGAPIKIRIVKGANLAMEELEASIEGWPQAPYTKKADVDANYKRMISYGLQKAHAPAVHIGVASHNMFDIAYALLLRSENEVEEFVTFEMLEGMADHQRRVVQELSGRILLYCPAATKEEFVNAIAYLVRRLDENTAPENFLRHAFDLVPGSKQWNEQALIFKNACEEANKVYSTSRRQQDRRDLLKSPSLCTSFKNEPNTDWSLEQNRLWAKQLIETGKHQEYSDIPCVISGKEFWNENSVSIGFDPSRPEKALYRYTLASEKEVEKALSCSIDSAKKWKETSAEEKNLIVAAVAQLIRKHRGDLISVMIADGGKTIREADAEVSEAIDFCDYYRHNYLEISSLEDVHWSPKGVILVTPPWNFPCAIPLGGIIAGLMTGNAVIFKPAPETILVSWHIAKICWDAGIPKDVLQFIVCEDNPVGSMLINDQRINSVILTGATDTAKLFLKMRPGLDLQAETGGKNAIIISRLSDRDLAIKNLIDSAFSHSGQKCSACSLAILEAEVYDDLHFHQQLKDAVESLSVGSAWNLKTKVNPLINLPNNILLKGLTTLEEGEEWLLKPKQDPENPRLWSPGIKIGVKEGSFTHQNEMFGPVLGIMRAATFKDAVRLANATKYGLTAGVHTLDIREQKYWLSHIEAGNCYINRGITGAVVERQPFGGCKQSSFGKGAKAGGPNYLIQLMHAEQCSLPKQREQEKNTITKLGEILKKLPVSHEDLNLFKASVESYSFYWNQYFSKKHDPAKLLGQDNYFFYKPRKKMTFRIQHSDSIVDIFRVIAAAMTCCTPLEVSCDKSFLESLQNIQEIKNSYINLLVENEERFLERIELKEVDRLRILSPLSESMKNACANHAINILKEPILANGRLELLNYLREVSISYDYHRYGNLGEREKEQRTPLPPSPVDKSINCCEIICCKK